MRALDSRHRKLSLSHAKRWIAGASRVNPRDDDLAADDQRVVIEPAGFISCTRNVVKQFFASATQP
jgi:hypothetical protein